MPFPRIDDDILLTLTLVIALVALASFISVYLYGRFAKRARGAPSWSIPIAGPETEADRTVAPLTASHPGETGIIVLARGRDAFRARALSARAAGRSLDMMYYLWRGDLTGSLLVREVLAAADRGVRVRLLLDDINTRGLDPEYLALTGHSGVEVRLFNPAKNRVTSLRRGAEMALRLLSVTRRMHNKAWIVDGRFAVIGGRNIGDTYFDAARDINSSDMDAALIGPAVAAVETIFDTYWNSPLTLPITSLWKDREADLRGFRRSLAAIAAGGDAQRFLEATPPDTGLGAVFGGEPALHWNDAPRILCDPPEKTQRGEPDRWMIRSLAPLIAAASREVRVTTAYFVPGKQGVEGLRGLAERGVAVSVLTNSLASTNQVTVHGGYSEARPALLEAGIRLFELRPQDRASGGSRCSARWARRSMPRTSPWMAGSASSVRSISTCARPSSIPKWGFWSTTRRSPPRSKRCSPPRPRPRGATRPCSRMARCAGATRTGLSSGTSRRPAAADCWSPRSCACCR